ncbi:hypothetical protein [Halobacillus massiliensis]|uniref:hypothetical protein n=1 Tax=Halobacillus massiliensis TaxID=1926286 RepID=UPI0009E2AE9B|nr:hypothetical protein [Halobacillus massiliensis]
MEIAVRKIQNRPLIKEFILKHWHASYVVRLDEKVLIDQLQGIAAGKVVGMQVNGECDGGKCRNRDGFDKSTHKAEQRLGENLADLYKR